MALKIEKVENNQLIYSLYNNRGNCYLKQFMYKEALKDFEKAYLINNADLKILYRLAFSNYKLGKFNFSLRIIIEAYDKFDELKDNSIRTV